MAKIIFRKVILHLPSTYWSLRREGEGHAMALRYLHMEQRLGSVAVAIGSRVNIDDLCRYDNYNRL
jgi:hypothetical protein